MPCYLPVMQYARDRDLREALYRGYGTVASEQGDAQFDNSPLIEELLSLRAEEAGLLGLGTFAGLRLQTRMARDAREVTEFLRDLAARAKPYAQRDLTELRAYADAELGLAELQPWDVPYASERLRESRYAYSEDEVKQYFTEPRVLAGLYEVIETLFNVRLVETPVSSWHADVRGVRVESPGGRADRPSVPGPVRARRQAERRLGRQRTHPPPGRRTPADAGGLPDLQFRAPTASAPPC